MCTYLLCVLKFCVQAFFSTPPLVQEVFAYIVITVHSTVIYIIYDYSMEYH